MTRSLAWALAAGFPIAVVVVGGVVLADVWLDIDYRVAANIMLLALAGLVVAFTGLYLRRSRWRSNRIGRIYAAMTVFLSILLTQACVAVWVSTDYPGRQHIRFIIYALGAVAWVPMLVSLWQEQQRDRRDKKRH